MYRIFGYECRRLLWNKFFFGLLLAVLFYGWQVLNTVTILGVSHTAPFSPQSFGDYLGRMQPLLWLGALFFFTFFASKAEKRRAALTAAAPVRPAVYRLTRCCAALAGTTLLCLAVVLLAFVFYEQMFHWRQWGSLLIPALAALAPAFVFALAASIVLLLAGQANRRKTALSEPAAAKSQK